MCGVAGYIDSSGSPVDLNVLKSMAAALAHRGPDGDGVWHESNVGLIHRRLSIIDLSDAARQPMESLDGRYKLSYNGMIYNYKELRVELQTLGCKFVSKSDTEVVLNVISIWGPSGLMRLDGMFALAIWDNKLKTLLLARDRYGIKPLYFGQFGKKLVFASEIKAILEVPGVHASIDNEALIEYFTFQNFFTQKTLFKDIQMLPSGSYAKFNLDSPEKTLKVTKYWDFNFCEPQFKMEKQEYEEELDRLFVQAVSRQLVSDVPVGSYLSGGIDSGSVVALASKHYPKLSTFTCGFDLSSASSIELAFDEREPARRIAKYFSTTHYETELRAGDMERVLRSLVHHLEEPRVGQSYPNYFAAELASQNVKVVLSGSGGDELFCGYPWRYFRMASPNNFDDFIDGYYKMWHRLVSNKELKEMCLPIRSDFENIWTRDIFANVFPSNDLNLNCPEDFINQSLYFEAKTFLHGLLVVEDKLSMAHGLETRVPFLDNDLVDFAMKSPIKLKLNNLETKMRVNENNIIGSQGKFIQKSADGKQILRDVLGNYLPDEIKNANKQGFSGPDASWFKGESMSFVKQKLFNKNARIYEYFDQSAVNSVVNEHLNGKSNRRLFIWSLLYFETFLDEFIT